MRSTIALFGGSRRNANTGGLIDTVASALNFEDVGLSERRIRFPAEYERRRVFAE